MTNAGIPLVIAGGVLFFVQIRYLVVKYILEMYIGEKNGGGERWWKWGRNDRKMWRGKREAMRRLTHHIVSTTSARYDTTNLTLLPFFPCASFSIDSYCFINSFLLSPSLSSLSPLPSTLCLSSPLPLGTHALVDYSFMYSTTQA